MTPTNIRTGATAAGWGAALAAWILSLPGGLADEPRQPVLRPSLPQTTTLPTLDLSDETARQHVIARGTKTVYQGHPTTVLMPDGRTIFAVWSYEHGGPCGPMARSDDGGRNWSGLLPVPGNWSEVRNCPTIYRLSAPGGKERLLVYAGQGPEGTMHQAHSDDGGKTWTPMRSNGLRCVMPFTAIVPVQGAARLLGITNIRRPGETQEERSNVIAQSWSNDGGLSWSNWRIVLDLPGLKPCEPALVRSPYGNQILCLMRENHRDFNSWKMLSDDEGANWSEPAQLPAALTGDRHMAGYAPDGRLVVVFRDRAKGSSYGHFVGWVGTYDDVLTGREGQYRFKLLHHHGRVGDTGYPGLEVLPDGTFVATTYVQYAEGERNSVVAVRFHLDELDRRVAALRTEPR